VDPNTWQKKRALGGIHVVASHLSEIEIADRFVLVRVIVQCIRAILVYEIGDGYEHTRHKNLFAAFPLPSKLFKATCSGRIGHPCCRVRIDVLSLRACELACHKNIRMKLVSLKP
jgi:hypothetical protein